MFTHFRESRPMTKRVPPENEIDFIKICPPPPTPFFSVVLAWCTEIIQNLISIPYFRRTGQAIPLGAVAPFYVAHFWSRDDMHSNAFYFPVDFNFVIFAHRQRIVNVKPLKINPKIGKIRVLLSWDKFKVVIYQCTLSLIRLYFALTSVFDWFWRSIPNPLTESLQDHGLLEPSTFLSFVCGSSNVAKI